MAEAHDLRIGVQFDLQLERDPSLSGVFLNELCGTYPW